MEISKRVALVAHDNCKKDLAEWVERNWKLLLDHKLICPGTTGRPVEEAIATKMDKGRSLKHSIVRQTSGPFGRSSRVL